MEFLMGVGITTNSFGLRDGQREKEKPPNAYRIVALGDSITMGWGVPQDRTYPAQLERMLNARPPHGFSPDLHYEVLNLGVGNYNTVQEVMRLKNLGLSFRPDMIILGYFINDAEETPKPTRGFLVEHSYLAAFLMSRIRLANPSASNYLDYYRGLYKETQPGWRATQAALREFASIGRERSIPEMLFIIPEMHKLGVAYPFADIHSKVQKAGLEAGLPVIDLLPVFDDRTPESALWVSPLDAHHNAVAQGLLAKGIYDSLGVGAEQFISSTR
jgi:lysophospholipase L1-like esterase